ncbi:hypothetical protein MNBD_ALPHA09-1277, partial [hydrothermal vent metagenome]
RKLSVFINELDFTAGSEIIDAAGN